MNSKAPIRLVVAGAGLIGQAHIRRILDEPGVELVGIADPAPRVRQQAEAIGVAWAPEVETLLDSVLVDGVVVALPNQLHYATGMALVERRVPMLMEKPVCGTVQEGLAFAEAAEKAAVPVLVGHHHRHGAVMQRAKAILATGRLGRVTAVHAFAWFLKPRDYFEGGGEWRRKPGGGVVSINLIHVIDDLRNLCGEIASVQAIESHAARGFPVEDTIGVVLRFENGALGTISLSDSAAAPWSWELTSGENKAYPRSDESCYFVAGMEGALSIPRLDFWHHTGEAGWWSPLCCERSVVPTQDAWTLSVNDDPLTNEMRHFCAVVRREAKPLLDARGATQTLAVTLAVKEAAESGQVVSLA
jgi:predicted dehydrogenase